MVRRRSRTVWVAGLWLVCQMCMFALPLAANALAADAEVCTCPGGSPGAPCPMHHHGLGDPSQQNGPVLKNACAQPDATLLALATGLGILPRTGDIWFDPTPTLIPSASSTPLQRAEVPDAPPPRI